MTKFFSETPGPPYYIVAFSSRRTEGDNGYAEMTKAMESARGADGFGITNSFWKDEANMKAWKANVDHKLAQKLGREIFYSHYVIRVAKVERDYSFEKADM